MFPTGYDLSSSVDQASRDTGAPSPITPAGRICPRAPSLLNASNPGPSAGRKRNAGLGRADISNGGGHDLVGIMVNSPKLMNSQTGINPFPSPGYPDFSRSGKSAAEFAQEPSQFARMAPGPSRRRGRPAPPTPRIWLTAGALLAVACQGGGERPLETSPGLSLAPWGLAEPAAAAARASEPVIAQPAVGQIRTSGAVPRAPGG